MGRAEGKHIVQMGESFVFKLMDNWRESADLQQTYPKIGDYVSKSIKESKLINSSIKDTKVTQIMTKKE